MTEDVLKRTTLINVDGISVVQVGEFESPPPPPPPPPVGDTYSTYADRQVTIAVGDNFQTKINANGAGTIYGVSAGTHLSAGAAGVFTPKANDKFVGETDAAGVPVTFLKGDWNQTQTGLGVVSPFTGTLPTGVQMLRLDFSLYASAIANSAMNSGTSWTYWKCTGRLCKSGAFRLGVSGLIANGKAHDNGQAGMFVHHPGDGIVNGIVDGMELYNNNLQGWSNPQWESGGLKFTGPVGTLQNITIRNCYAHNNNGPGIWFDGCAGGHLVEDNRCEDNTQPGIKYEITLGAGTIQRNTCRRNGGGANIYINNSAGTAGNLLLIQDNVCETSTSHAEIWLEDASTRSPRIGYITIRRNTVRRNFVTGVNNIATGQFPNNGTPPGMVINENNYYVASGVLWQWLGTGRTWAQWQALGFDLNGTQQPF